MNVLVINSGSSSFKFDVIDVDTQQTLAGGQVERIGAVSALATVRVGEGKKERQSLQAPDHGAAIRFVLDRLLKGEGRLDAEIGAVGHRVVHGGEQFAESVPVDEEVCDAIRDAFDLAPLHNPANLKGIEAAQQALPDVPHVAVFDTAFHQTLPPEAYLYAIPQRLYRRHKIRRYGFHGPSHYYVSRRLFELAGLPVEGSRVVTAHLGNGCSMAALRDGQSVDTSMGMTPLAGLIMGTRSGTIDPAVIFDLVEKEEMTLSEVHALLNRYSGLLGLSGYAADMRDLIAEAERGDARCRQAVEAFCYRARCYLGMYMAVLGGLDALVFTAGIGAHSPRVREMTCEGLSGLGIVLDDERNEAAVGTEARISADDSAVEVWAIPTNEELVIALDTAKIARARVQSPYV
ncbi:MAG: acetate kinase [Rhodothermales bacterium]|nr:acetate kinase [Rhodothermales bacterium]